MLEIEQFSSVKGVEIEGTDMQFHSQFSSGCNSVPWQKEVRNCFGYISLHNVYSKFLDVRK